MPQTSSRDIDESALTKGHLRKLNALRKSVGKDIGERAFGRAVCRWPLSLCHCELSDDFRLRSLGTAAARRDLFSDPRIHFGLDPADGARA